MIIHDDDDDDDDDDDETPRVVHHRPDDIPREMDVTERVTDLAGRSQTVDIDRTVLSPLHTCPKELELF